MKSNGSICMAQEDPLPLSVRKLIEKMCLDEEPHQDYRLRLKQNCNNNEKTCHVMKSLTGLNQRIFDTESKIKYQIRLKP